MKTKWVRPKSLTTDVEKGFSFGNCLTRIWHVMDEDGQWYRGSGHRNGNGEVLVNDKDPIDGKTLHAEMKQHNLEMLVDREWEKYGYVS
jgi:hypothetical protein